MEVPLELPQVDWMMKLSFSSEINEDPENYVGIAPVAKEGLDDLDARKPPLFMDQGFLYFERPEWDQNFKLFSSDFRPTLGDGQTWDFAVRNPRRTIGTIRFTGMDRVPAEYEVHLVNLSNTVPVNLRSRNEYSYRSAEEVTRFKLIIGKKEYVDTELASFVPQSFKLLQNYPNPFNSGTTLTFKVARESNVRLEIVSILGQTVRTLVDTWLTPGTYSAWWDGTDHVGSTVASGVYVYRLVRDGKPVDAKKLTILK